ncbi:unnamed protein product [Fusarium equiseti]|uniref:C2H2-type domain-containing protein n=1 Tax=Fusarium equiseti TaxID=61235 RepID=A0A8J2NLN3_FUSEQ|nr:unnamed protein product [Fusarium equiseti]
MEGGNSSGVGGSQNTIPCVIGDKYPEFCSKSFPTIEKHNDHLKGCHSPEYWCEACSHKFNVSLAKDSLRLAKQEHEKMCPGESSEENRELRSKTFTMSQEQIGRFNDEGWKKTRVPGLAFEDGNIESLPEQWWRQIRETIFPDSDTKVLRVGRFQVVQALADPTLPPAGMPSRKAIDGPVIMRPGLGRIDSTTLMSREDLNKRGLMREPRRGWSTTDYKGDRIVSDLPQPAPLQSDSGYQPMKRDTKEGLPPGVSEEGLSQAKVQEVESCIKETPMDYAIMTMLSSAMSIPADVLDDLVAELPRKLYNDLRLIDAALDFIEWLDDAVSPLIRSFALRMGSAGSSKAEREIMLFVYRNRDKITAAFNSLVEGSNDHEDSLRGPDKSLSMPEDAILKWRANIESGEIPSITQPDIAEMDHAEERPSAIDEGGYRELIFNSVAYRWLLAGLVQKLTLEVVNVNLNLRSRIHQDVCDCFEFSRHISRQKERYQMSIVANWNPTEFLYEQFGSRCDIGRLLGETLTFTGTATDAQILPCSEYLKQTWPTTGPAFLHLLKKALVSDKHASGELEDKTTVQCDFVKRGLTVQIEGITDSIATICEQIGWLGAALRPSSSRAKFATCRPIFTISNPSVSNSGTDRAGCLVEFPITLMDFTEDTPGQCWHAIHRDPVIVEGYPIPRRKRYGSGLEMPLNVMAGLNSSPRIHKYGGSYYLKGYSTALVPTEKIDNMILWHLYYSGDGSRLPYPNPNGLHCTDLSMQDLTAARHVVGWCSNAKFMTGAADMNYVIGASKLQRPGKEFALEKISFSFGQFVTGGCQFAIGRKDQHLRATKDTYIKKLRWLDKKYVTLWDVDDERGWLVNGNAALLHLLRSSLQHSSTDKFSSDFHFQAQDFQESKNPHTLDSALEVLRNSKNQQLELYDKDTDIQQGYSTTTRTTVKDLVEELYETLEKLFDHTATSESSSKGLNAKSRFQDHLKGWDFTDIATNRDPFFIKRTTLGLSMLGWPDLVRATSAIVLFGKGFGDLIEAVGAQQGGACKEWMTVPKNSNLLNAWYFVESPILH